MTYKILEKKWKNYSNKLDFLVMLAYDKIASDPKSFYQYNVMWKHQEEGLKAYKCFEQKSDEITREFIEML